MTSVASVVGGRVGDERERREREGGRVSEYKRASQPFASANGGGERSERGEARRV